MKRFPYFLSLILVGGTLAALQKSAVAQEPVDTLYVSVRRTVQLPGHLLPPGKYIFQAHDEGDGVRLVYVYNLKTNKGYGMYAVARGVESTHPAVGMNNLGEGVPSITAVSFAKAGETYNFIYGKRNKAVETVERPSAEGESAQTNSRGR